MNWDKEVKGSIEIDGNHFKKIDGTVRFAEVFVTKDLEFTIRWRKVSMSNGLSQATILKVCEAFKK